MGANDDEDYPWLEKECELLLNAVNGNMPVVGICLGGQLLARALGARVERNKKPEIGWHPIQLTEEGQLDRIFGSLGKEALVYHWHFDTFHLPSEAVLLSGSSICARQSYRIGDQIYGFQFHPEVDHQLLGEWLTDEEVAFSIRESVHTYGSQWIQPVERQMELAFEGEKAGMKIVAGIGQLFQILPYRPSEHPSVDLWRPLLAEWVQNRVQLEVILEGSNRKEFCILGTVIGTISTSDGEFLIMKDQNTLLWPIRIDLILSLKQNGKATSRNKTRIKKALKSRFRQQRKHLEKNGMNDENDDGC
jgi:GMP synthase-like glutamine amidotransferase